MVFPSDAVSAVSMKTCGAAGLPPACVEMLARCGSKLTALKMTRQRIIGASIDRIALMNMLPDVFFCSYVYFNGVTYVFKVLKELYRRRFKRRQRLYDRIRFFRLS